MRKLSMQSKKGMSVREGIQYFLRKCAARNLSDATIEVYDYHLCAFQKFLNDDSYMIADITMKTVDDFIFAIKETNNCKAITVNTYLRDLRVFLYFCMGEGYLTAFKIKLAKVDKGIKETYTDTELKALLKKPNIKACDFSEYKIWVFSNYLLATGNRISSALNLKISDLDLDGGIIQVNKVKNRKAQIIPMSAALNSILKEYLIYRKGKAEDYVFCSNYGTKPDKRTYQEMLKNYNNQRGIHKTSAHLYRHTFAKKWILNGGDIFRLQKILGHSDLSMVREYVNMFGNDIAIDFNRFNPLDNMDCSHTREKIKL